MSNGNSIFFPLLQTGVLTFSVAFAITSPTPLTIAAAAVMGVFFAASWCMYIAGRSM